METLNMSKCTWTEDEEKTLKVLAGQMPIGRISSIMGRSESSIYSKAFLLGLSLRSKTSSWDTKRLEELANLRLEGKSWTDISKHFDVGEEGCKSAFYRHKKALKDQLLESMFEKFKEVLVETDLSKEQIEEAMTKMRSVNLSLFFDL